MATKPPAASMPAASGSEGHVVQLDPQSIKQSLLQAWGIDAGDMHDEPPPGIAPHIGHTKRRAPLRTSKNVPATPSAKVTLDRLGRAPNQGV